MSLAEEFLFHASELIAPGGTLTAIHLRRIVSASYYALFHQLVEDAVKIVGPNISDEIAHRVQRWFEHGTMKQICGRFVKPQLAQPLIGLVGDSASPDLQSVCAAFISLQDARHDADYNPAYDVEESDALQHFASAVLAIGVWKSIRNTS